MYPMVQNYLMISIRRHLRISRTTASPLSPIPLQPPSFPQPLSHHAASAPNPNRAHRRSPPSPPRRQSPDLLSRLPRSAPVQRKTKRTVSIRAVVCIRTAPGQRLRGGKRSRQSPSALPICIPCLRTAGLHPGEENEAAGLHPLPPCHRSASTPPPVSTCAKENEATGPLPRRWPASLASEPPVCIRATGFTAPPPSSHPTPRITNHLSLTGRGRRRR
uniref:Uncharacterized protein n=1 Tax=Oryza punctata TaxID=4537 RepID=A0A0E0K8Y5_ORYPU